MRKKLFAVIMSTLMLISFMPAMAFASEEADFDIIRGCRKMSYVEPVKYSKYAQYLDLTLVDKTIDELADLKYDNSKSYDENTAVIFGLCSKLYETYFNQYKTAIKKEIDKLNTDVSVTDIIKDAKADVDALVFVYETDPTFDTYLAPIELVLNKCKVNIECLNNPKAITAKKVSQKAISAKKNGTIAVKFAVVAVGDAKVAQYEVWRSTSKNFKKGIVKYSAELANVDAGTVTFTNAKGMKKGTKYFYKVRGVVDGKTYTKWSKAQSAKCKKTVK